MNTTEEKEKAVRRNVEALRELVNREHHLLNTRTSIFLLWQSVLMAGLWIGSVPSPHVIAVCALGLLSSIIWLYMGYYSRVVTAGYWGKLNALEHQLPSEDRIYTWARKFRTQVPGRILSVNKCLAYVFPVLWIVTWIGAYVLRVWSTLPSGST